MSFDLAIIGGGAAGFFTAIQLKETHPTAKIIILEKTQKTLSKVKISGGGRCNVTHACFDPSELVEYYPRGRKELISPFTKFMCGDMMAWLDEQGIETKIEDDNRVFPVSDDSQTIIDCFEKFCKKNQIEVRTQSGVIDLKRKEENWELETNRKEQILASNLMIATGSAPSFWKLLASKGHKIIQPVPSLFTFNIKDPLIEGLQGLSVPLAEVKIKNLNFESDGPLLITHWGLSGPAIIKLSSWAARELNTLNYEFEIMVNWLASSSEDVILELESNLAENPKKLLENIPFNGIPKRLWTRMVEVSGYKGRTGNSLNNKEVKNISTFLCSYTFQVKGKSTFKEEFVTSGGIDRKEVDFRTMESKILKSTFLAGEVIDIDAVTGGFNFQAAWTGAHIASLEIASRLAKD